MRILFIGDVFGKPGRHLLSEQIPLLKKKHNTDFIIVNVENSAGGKGLSEKTAKEIFELPIDAGTGGNHIWEQKDHKVVFKKFPVVRPLNIEDQTHGFGYMVIEKNGKKLAVVSLQGSIHMDGKGVPTTNPFHEIENLLKMKEIPKCVLVDFHAEATSEKKAMLWFLNGRVSALLGTHTHIQTADEFITDEGTAYITDVGMTGPHKSVIGMRIDRALDRFLKNEKKSLIVAKEGLEINGVIVDVDEKNGKAFKIERIRGQV